VKGSRALAIGQSHSPLIDYVRPSPDVDLAVAEALAESRRQYHAFAPDLVVLFFPDHFNGFLYDLMPPFCIGAAGCTIGDYGTLAGPVRIDERLAESCAQHVLDAGFDIALSYDMVMDHGAAQPLANLGGALDAVDVLPVFLNSVAVPLAPMSRIVGLGRAIGEFARTLDRRVAFVASGGLSHDPPLPHLSSATPDQREMLIRGRNLSAEQRSARQNRVIAAGEAFATHGGAHIGIRDLNPDWDISFMEWLAAGDIDAVAGLSVADITCDAGNSGHEVRSWAAAFSALAAFGEYEITQRFYRAIPEWIAGFGCMTAISRYP
jgi:2,3-dihydroxyphenylpropionate 1,2-dioxygenase